MILPVDPAKILRLFAPLWVLLALSLWLYWGDWQTKPVMLTAIAFLPIAAALGAGLVRERWRLELTAEALIHHTLGRREVFAWSRMGPIEIRPAPFLDRVLVRTFWFAFPVDGPRSVSERVAHITGRRILCVFGDLSAVETVKQIEAWRALYASRA